VLNNGQAQKGCQHDPPSGDGHGALLCLPNQPTPGANGGTDGDYKLAK
jgi:hypothetical protein